MAKHYHWKLQRRELNLGDRTLLMGVLNVTPDSFSDGGKYLDPDRAYARALELEEEGADIIDIGAESTRPGSQRVSEPEEIRRLIPVLKRLRDKLRIPISVDTYKSAVAEKSLELGAEIINDPSGNLWDLQMSRVITKHDAGYIINHMRGTPETWANMSPLKNLMNSIGTDLDAALNRARLSGVQKHQLVIDPGIGFGKRREQNTEIISHLHQLASFDLPIAIGPSRKSFLKAEDSEALEYATAAAVTASILNGAHIIRVHDVKRMRAVADVADAVRNAQQAEAPPESETVKRPARDRLAADQPQGPVRPARPIRPERPERSTRPERPERPIKPERPFRPERSTRPDRPPPRRPQGR